MTDEQLDRMVRDADPYRPGVIRHLAGAEQNLLEEIMSVPVLECVPEPPGSRPRARRGVLSSLAGASVAAAVLVGVLAAAIIDTDRPGSPQASPPTGSPVDAASYRAMLLKAAEENPRLLIDQPGWKATSVYGFTKEAGTIAFTNGGRRLEMNWYPARDYQDYYEDRLEVSKPEPVKVDGQPGELFRYSDSDFAIMVRPRDGSFVELRAGGAWTRDDFDKVIARVVRVDVQTWLAALPPEIVTPGRLRDQAAKVLADVPLPPGFDIATLDDLGPNDPYQFGAEVTSRVGCGWIAEWRRAKEAGDDSALQRARNAMRGSHNWKVLHEMNDEGDWPEVFWETADEVAAGHLPDHYQDAIGCR